MQEWPGTSAQSRRKPHEISYMLYLAEWEYEVMSVPRVVGEGNMMAFHVVSLFACLQHLLPKSPSTLLGLQKTVQKMGSQPGASNIVEAVSFQHNATGREALP